MNRNRSLKLFRCGSCYEDIETERGGTFKRYAFLMVRARPSLQAARCNFCEKPAAPVQVRASASVDFAALPPTNARLSRDGLNLDFAVFLFCLRYLHGRLEEGLSVDDS